MVEGITPALTGVVPVIIMATRGIMVVMGITPATMGIMETDITPVVTDTIPAETDTTPVGTDTIPAETGITPVETGIIPAGTVALMEMGKTQAAIRPLRTGETPTPVPLPTDAPVLL